jgi:uncharacterized protein (TIGR02466 family)
VCPSNFVVLPLEALMAEILTLFATRLYRAPLGGKNSDGLCAELANSCEALQSEDRAGRTWCRDNGYKGYTSYASLSDLPRRDPAFEDLRKALDKHVASFAKEVGFDLAGGKLKLDSLWVNVLPAGGVHTGHIHPHSVISGTYYVAVPQDAASLKLEDPRLPMMMAAPTRLPEAEQSLQPFVFVRPQEGEVILWESWLRHEVVLNRARAPRISISFNYAWV